MSRLRRIIPGFAAALLLMLAGAAVETRAQQPVNLLELMVQSPLGDLWLGKDDAPVTVIEYASMTCPHCRAFHETVFDDFRRDFIDTGKVRFILREFPLDTFAAAAFVLARCQPGPEGYYGLIEVLFERQAEWAGNYNAFLGLALQSGFTQETFDACLANRPIIDGVFWSYDRGITLGVTGTPTFFINGEKYQGEISLAELGAVINRML